MYLCYILLFYILFVIYRTIQLFKKSNTYEYIYVTVGNYNLTVFYDDPNVSLNVLPPFFNGTLVMKL